MRDDGERYARALSANGVPVQAWRYRGTSHGFFQLTGALDSARRLHYDLGEWLSQEHPERTRAQPTRTEHEQMNATLTDTNDSYGFPAVAAADAVRRELEEDHVFDDVTTTRIVGTGLWVRGKVVTREAGIVAGLPLVARVYRRLDPSVQISPTVVDGARVEPGDELLNVEGPARSVITGERVALNFLQRLSGIATVCSAYVSLVSDLAVTILDTRKTVPGLRQLDKYAVTCGGATNHRKDLSALVVTPEENHVAAAGGVTQAVEAVRLRGRGPPERSGPCCRGRGDKLCAGL